MTYLFEAFILGLSTGPVCLAYCAPVLAPLIVSGDEPYRLTRTMQLLGLFLLGRLGGYLAVGVITGLIGSAVFKSARGMGGVVTLVMGIMLLAFGIMKNFPRLKLCQMVPTGRSTVGWAVALGFLTGLSICPPFIAAVTASASLGAFHSSVFYFAAFFVGTALYIPPMVLLGPLSGSVPANHIAKICLFLTGIWFTYKGIIEIALTS
ncbi:MAG: sulfite exporter TauE/SafE family protein [bacterium]|nr:sulfite exporter TauE/SafE family protein [bacterium]